MKHSVLALILLASTVSAAQAADTKIEDVLNANIGTASGVAANNSKETCDVDVDVIAAMHTVTMGIYANVFFLTYPNEGVWTIDQKKGILISSNPAEKEAFKFDYDLKTLRFKKWTRLLSGNETSACELKK